MLDTGRQRLWGERVSTHFDFGTTLMAFLGFRVDTLWGLSVCWVEFGRWSRLWSMTQESSEREAPISGSQSILPSPEFSVLDSDELNVFM